MLHTPARAELEVVDAEEAEGSEPLEYSAFRVGGGDKGRQLIALDIRTIQPLWNAPAYSGLLLTQEDGEAGTYLVLHYAFLQVHIKGRNLRPVAAAIKRHRCAAIWEYDATRWPMPKDKSAPFIESVVIKVTGLDAPV